MYFLQSHLKGWGRDRVRKRVRVEDRSMSCISYRDCYRVRIRVKGRVILLGLLQG